MLWFKNKGEADDVCVSTRIRLARNAKDIPFAEKYTDEQAAYIAQMVKEALSSKDFEFLNLDNAPSLNVSALVEEHMISPEMTKGKNKSVMLDKNSTVSIMIGEEDHIRLQVILPGLALDGAYERADELDNLISKKLNYAYHEEYGFLTRCATNTGTGMRASVMLYLPAIKMAGKMNQLIGEVGKLGLTFRGVYGEGSDSKGDMYQLSNQITLGLSEEQIIEKLKNVTNQIIKTERELRSKFLEVKKDELEDKVWRAYGTLKYAKKLTSAECSSLLSTVKLGACLGILKDIKTDKINELIVITEPAHISLEAKRQLTADERDKERAKLVNKSI